MYGGTEEDVRVGVDPVRSSLRLDMECQSQRELGSPVMKEMVCSLV